jgi:hypothetical protein
VPTVEPRYLVDPGVIGGGGYTLGGSTLSRSNPVLRRSESSRDVAVSGSVGNWDFSVGREPEGNADKIAVYAGAAAAVVGTGLILTATLSK